MRTRIQRLATDAVRALRFDEGSSNATIAHRACSLLLADWDNVSLDPAGAKVRVSEQIALEQPRRFIGIGWITSIIVGWIVNRVLNWLLAEAQRNPKQFTTISADWPEAPGSD